MRVDGEFDLNTLRLDGEIFESAKKKLRIQKYPHTCGRGLSRPPDVVNPLSVSIQPLLSVVSSKKIGRYDILCLQFFLLVCLLQLTRDIFTRRLKSLVKYWRCNGFNIALFLDDGWLIDSDRDTCAVLATNMWSDLRKSGFITNDEKSQ